MGLDNSRSALIAWGSHAPGGVNHGKLADLPGTWRKGFILATPYGPGDIGPGETARIEAWLPEMATPEIADSETPEAHAWRVTLFERWQALDQTMGPTWGRDDQHWWPEGSNAVAGTAGMRVANIYLPIARYARLSDLDDLPHPDDEYDLPKLWHQVRRGEKRYDWSDFIALIKDSRADDLDGLFGDLPNSAEFLRRLKRFFADHALKDGSILRPGGDSFYSYAYPLQRNALPLPQLVALAQQHLAQRAGFLDRAGAAGAATSLRGLRFATGQPEGKTFGDADDALEKMGDLLRGRRSDHPYWSRCLNEACYGITAYFEIRDWLMLPFTGITITPPGPKGLATRLRLRAADPGFDLELAYQLWKGGGAYAFDGDRCHVWEIDRREG